MRVQFADTSSPFRLRVRIPTKRTSFVEISFALGIPVLILTGRVVVGSGAEHNKVLPTRDLLLFSEECVAFSVDLMGVTSLSADRFL